MAEPYLKDMDFAFFAVNFGYSKADYESLTSRDKAFIYKAWEDRIIRESYNLYNAVFTATYNVNRPKKKRALKLWKKASIRKANMEDTYNSINVVRENERKEGREWIDKIYAANGLSGPRRKDYRKGGGL